MTFFPPLSRRAFLAAAAAATAAHGQSSLYAPAGRVVESRLVSTKQRRDPDGEVQVDVVVEGPGSGEQRIPAFWSGDQLWRWRFSAREPGRYRYRSVASDASDGGLHGVEGEILVGAYEGDNPLYRRGALQVSANRRYLEHEDGQPFFWLGDTWWMGLTERLRWPEEFQEIATDRVAKGFNVIQIVAGLYPDQPAFDPRGRNEAGFPWEKDFTRINPGWWDLADLRMQRLIEVGLLPCVLGCWGYYLPILGEEKMRRHWRTIIARWGAYPVVWCLAGEGSMPWYLSERREAEQKELEQGWTRMARYVRETDPFGRLITMHPSRSGREVVTDPAVLDFDMLQTGHGDYRSIPRTVQQVVAAYQQEPRMPVIESEVCYEGIMQSCREDIQRFMFWTTILNGCCGFTYGANGVWQVNRPERPFGPSPHGRAWGDTPWREAMQAPGSAQVGAGAEILRGLPWQRLEPHPEWISPRWSEQDYHAPSAAGVSSGLRVFYMPNSWETPTLQELEPGRRYRPTLVNPGTGERIERAPIAADASGEHKLDKFPEQRDWVLVLEPE